MERFATPSSFKKEAELLGERDLFRPNLQHRIGARFMTRYCSEKKRRGPDRRHNAEDRNRSKVSREKERESVCVGPK